MWTRSATYWGCSFSDLRRDTRGDYRKLLARLGVDAAAADTVNIQRHNTFAALPRTTSSQPTVVTFKPFATLRVIVPAGLRPTVESALLKSPPRPDMEPSARRLLEEAFAPERPRLEAMLGRRLPW